MSNSLDYNSGASTSPGDARSIRNGLLQPTFIIPAVILLVAAIGLNGSVQYLRLHFKKLEVPLPQKLTTLPETISHWVQVSKDEPIDKDLEDNLQTNQYLFRDYVNATALGKTVPAVQKMFDGKSDQERKVEILKLRHTYPEAVVSLGLTYYTGKADTVAHIPERCYLADGYTQLQSEVRPWATAVQYISFESRADDMNPARLCNVAYFFEVNGESTPSSDVVRLTLQDLRCKYAYYAKVEMMNTVTDREKSGAVMHDFLAAVRPDVQKLMPNWANYKGK